jgi:hypothetical protein
MKKLLIVLLLSFACTTIYAQVTSFSTDIYADGNSYGFSVTPISNAVSYDWHVQGSGTSTIYYSGTVMESLIDVIFDSPGYYDITCIITLEDDTQIEQWCGVGVKKEE